MRGDVEFRADDGTMLRGWLQVPNTGRRCPTVVMIHGSGGHKEWFLPRLADVLEQAGIASLAYDHRNFGASDGQTRFEVDPPLQIRDLRTAVTFATTRPEVDPERIGIFGTSLGGGHVLVAGAIDRRVRCVVSQVPLISGLQNALRRYTPDQLADLRVRFDADRQRRYRDGAPETVPHAVLDVNDSTSGRTANRVAFFRAMTEDEKRPWENRLTLRSFELMMEYEPGTFISRISPTPLLMIVAEDDRSCGTDVSLQAYAAALEPKHLLLTRGGHYDVYMSELAVATAAARDWFARFLLGTDRSGVLA